ncbi:hypothetical protein ALQ93_04994, partial [Pseudomonas syringae pv. pisi]
MVLCETTAMASPDPIMLCTYRYDPLDRLASSSPFGQADIQRFYQKNRLATEIEAYGLSA